MLKQSIPEGLALSENKLKREDSDTTYLIKLFKERIKRQILYEQEPPVFILFNESKQIRHEHKWIQENYDRFLKDTPNEILVKEDYLKDLGFMYCMIYSPDGEYIITGHSTGLIQMRHGQTGIVLATLRNIQFPPKPIYALEYSLSEENVCYAACADGAIYKVDIPKIEKDQEDAPKYCIRADPALECLNIQYYSAHSTSCYATPFIIQRSPAQCVGITADKTKMVTGYADCSVRVTDMETQETEINYKMHKMRLQFTPKKLQRLHIEQVCALRCHDTSPKVFATGAWDNTLRLWDTRCAVGCMCTFEGVNICHDSIDLHRDQCISGSWSPTEALIVWDIRVRKKLHVVRAQNRRPDVDGEYIYACRYWKSSAYNRKGKYAIIGGSGTNCVEVINLHNRYISCSYPAEGTVLAIASHQNRIAFGGTSPILNIVSFYDPKHEKYYREEDRYIGPVQDYEIDLTTRSSIMEELARKAAEEALMYEMQVSDEEENTLDEGQK